MTFNILSNCQLPSSYGLGETMFGRSGGKGSLTQSVNELMSNKGDCRAAPASSGLLIMKWIESLYFQGILTHVAVISIP